MNQQPIAASRALLMHRRLVIFGVAMALVACSAALRALWVQGIDASGAAAEAVANMKESRPIRAGRGAIIDRNGVVLAEDFVVGRLIADPWNIQTNGITGRELTEDEKMAAEMAPGDIAKILLAHLGGTMDDFLYHLTRITNDDGSSNSYELVATNVSLYTFEQIMNDMSAGCNDGIVGGCYYGLSLEPSPQRSYPNGMIAANVVGFTLTDEQGNRIGAAGIEQYLDSQLAGTDGVETYLEGDYGIVPFANSTLRPAVDGMNVQLTIDSELQYALQQELQAAVARSQAQQGWAIVTNVKTGEILALANYPTFDPNDFAAAAQADLGNRAVDWTYEPGSVAKVLTMAALLDQELIDNDTRVVVPASLPSGADSITDSWPHGTLYMTARGILAQSSNIGTAQLARLSTTQALHDYWTRFGLGSPTGIENPGEGTSTLGILPSPNMEGYERDRASFGQSLSVTAVQMAAALGAVVNGGVYHAPTLVAGVTNPDGTPVASEREPARRVISQEASAAIRDMMEAQAMATYSESEALPGFSWLGKSGTAQRIDPDSGLYRAYTSSYVGVAPAEDPTILVYMVLDNTYETGSSVARPPVVNILRYALPRYGFAPAGYVEPYVGDQYYRP